METATTTTKTNTQILIEVHGLKETEYSAYAFQTARSISDAWKKLRFMRDHVPADELNTLTADITLPESLTYDRIPSVIAFIQNKNGKIQFKDWNNALRRELKNAKKAKEKLAQRLMKKIAKAKA